MSDNIFDRLMELLQSPGPVNWRLAAEMASSIAGTPAPVDAKTAAEYEQLTRAAQLRVAPVAIGLEVATELPEVRAVDRTEWARSNVESFRYLVEPLADQIQQSSDGGPLDALLKPLGPAILGMQMGTMVGLMSERVLGQFDVGLPTAEPSAIFYVVPNIERFTVEHEVDPAQARLWVAMHEVAHHAEFSLPWVGRRFAELVAEYLGGLEFDPSQIAAQLENVEDPAELERMFSDPAGMAGLVVGHDQQQALEGIQAFMALIEGYADYLMERAAPDLIPDAPRLREALDRRRAEPSQGERVLQQLLGLELKRQQYRLGADFCTQVARRWGDDGLARLWEGPDNLPTLPELNDPLGWAARVLITDIDVG